MFRDRVDAGQQLAHALEGFQDVQPVILGLPRGGVVVAATIARHLQSNLDVLLVKKIRAPGNPEFALGAVTEEGRSFLNPESRELTRTNQEYLKQEIESRLAEMAEQRRRYRKFASRVSLTGRTVVVVDDGLATGSTMIAAIGAVCLKSPHQLIVAVPVAPLDTVNRLQDIPQVSMVECLRTPTWFRGVGEYYRDFTQVDDDEVMAIIKQFN